MKGIAGRHTRGLLVGSKVPCADNTGAKIVQIVQVFKYHGTKRRVPSAGIGDMVLVSVKKGSPELRKQLFPAVVVRQRRPFRRSDGIMVSFEDNAVVLTTPTGETKGSDIKGPVAREAAERYARIAANASTIV
ncbi:MAG: 50S ribosomal protein L14 [Candidatus Thermoplasmatota archaeon]|nr:50S ribosomal protein L14 [Candidatus Thermoplasmatota archaeon]